MDNITAAILLALSAFLTFASLRFKRKSRAKSAALLPALFGALTLLAALYLAFGLFGAQ